MNYIFQSAMYAFVAKFNFQIHVKSKTLAQKVCAYGEMTNLFLGTFTYDHSFLATFSFQSITLQITFFLERNIQIST